MMTSSESGRSLYHGWLVIGAYALVCAGTQVLWLTYAAIDTSTAHHYGVSVSAVGWLSEIAPLLYVVLAIPAGIMLDNWFRPALLAGGGLMALGGLIRLGGDSFAWAMAGQVVGAAAQPLVLSAMGKVAGDYLPVDQRPAGVAMSSAGKLRGASAGPDPGPDDRRSWSYRASAGRGGGACCRRGAGDGSGAAPPGL